MKLTAPKRKAGRSVEAVASLVAVLATLAVAAFFVLSRLNAPPAAAPTSTLALAAAPVEGTAPAEAGVAVSPTSAAPAALSPAAPTDTLAAELVVTEAGPTTGAPATLVSQATPSTAPTLPPAFTPTQPAAGATNSPAPTATQEPTTVPDTAVPSATPTAEATATLVPTATAPALPLEVLNDQGCLRTELNQLYIFGEVHNPTETTYDVYNLRAQVFGEAGELGISHQWFDLPGDFYVAPGVTLPFVIIANLEQPGYTRYTVDLTVEPTERTPRSDLNIQEFSAVPEAGQVELTGRWAHTGPRPAQFVSIVATAYDGEGRVTNMGYVYLTSTLPQSPGLPEGQHPFELYLPVSPCGEGNISVSILGE